MVDIYENVLTIEVKWTGHSQTTLSVTESSTVELSILGLLAWHLRVCPSSSGAVVNRTVLRTRVSLESRSTWRIRSQFYNHTFAFLPYVYLKYHILRAINTDSNRVQFLDADHRHFPLCPLILALPPYVSYILKYVFTSGGIYKVVNPKCLYYQNFSQEQINMYSLLTSKRFTDNKLKMGD